MEEQTKAALGGPPAYVRRALRVEGRVDALFARAAKRHAAIMRFVEMRRREGRSFAVVEATIERCNARWKKWVEADDRFDAVNAEIEAYNRHYPVERNAALKHVPLDQVTFEPKASLGPADVYARFPLATSS
jgi:hypothetical protein